MAAQVPRNQESIGEREREREKERERERERASGAEEWHAHRQLNCVRREGGYGAGDWSSVCLSLARLQSCLFSQSCLSNKTQETSLRALLCSALLCSPWPLFVCYFLPAASLCGMLFLSAFSGVPARGAPCGNGPDPSVECCSLARWDSELAARLRSVARTHRELVTLRLP